MDNLLIFISNAIIQTFLCGYAIYSISKFFNSEEYSKKQILLLIVTMLTGSFIGLIIKSYLLFLNIVFSLVMIALISHSY